MKNEIAAIVVTYNRCALLSECIAALLRQTYRAFDILIIDNASTDGTEEYLRELVGKGQILYYNTGSNLGGAGGFNYGIRTAFALGYSFFWLMDDDTIPGEDALARLVSAGDALDGDYGYLCSRALWTDGTDCRMNIPEFPKGTDVSCVDGSGAVRIIKATFVSFFVPRFIVEKVGLPIKEFFIWADDTNYCLRINRVAAGYLVPDSVIVHKMNTNSRADIVTDDSRRLERYVYAFRNRFYNYRMEGKTPAYFIYICKRFCKILLFAADCRIERIRYMLRGVRQGFSFRPEIEYAECAAERED